MGWSEMSSREPTIKKYRAMLRSGQSALRGQQRTTPNDHEFQSGLTQYRRIFGMLDSMTVVAGKAVQAGSSTAFAWLTTRLRRRKRATELCLPW